MVLIRGLLNKLINAAQHSLHIDATPCIKSTEATIAVSTLQFCDQAKRFDTFIRRIQIGFYFNCSNHGIVINDQTIPYLEEDC